MKILIDEVKLNLLLEQKRNFIGNKVAWDSILSACSFLISVIFASYGDLWKIPGLAFKIVFLIVGFAFTIKAVVDVCKSKKNSYTYDDLLKDINTLNEITHNHSIVAIRDSFNAYPNRFLVYEDPQWECKLFLATIENFPEDMKQDTFICDGRTYHWKSIIELEKDKIAMEKNEDIIRFVKESI